MNIMVLGSGGREHALAWKIKQSPLVEKIYCIPGNPGTKSIADNVQISLDDFDALADFVIKNQIELTVVGPEDPLVSGIVDYFHQKELKIFGPSKKAARLEGSKDFAKKLMHQNGIPTAAFATFTDFDNAESYIAANHKYPIVLKADGLAAGKGVLICNDQRDALNGLNKIMKDRSFGQAGEKLIIEEFLEGDEVSIFAICDGENFVLLPPAQDHKKIGEADTGKNTGGMGAYAPAPIATDELLKYTTENVIKPTLLAMAELGTSYTGLLYVGLIVVGNKPYVLEYNCRFGDPETQAVLPLVKSDLVPFLLASAEGELQDMNLEQLESCAMDVVLTSGGYPDSYEKNYIISGLDSLDNSSLVFHAGTKDLDGKVVTSGGRVLNLVAVAESFEGCAEKVYSDIKKIHFEKMYYRKDIGFKVLKKK